MNTELLLHTFERDDYLLLDDFFDAKLMQALNARVLEHFGDDPAFLHSDDFLQKAKTDVIPWFPQDAGRSEFDLVDNNVDLQQRYRR
jgi:hypothetical protein